MTTEEQVEMGLETPPVETEAAPAVETPSAKEEVAEPSAAEKEADAALAEEAGAAKEKEDAPAVDAYKPNLKFKSADKEYDIPKEFHGLMKDTASERLVRDLHERAYAMDAMKVSREEIKRQRDSITTENQEIKGSIDELRTVYKQAVSTGNLLKLDQFFDKLKIPHQTVLNYALQKVQFMEMAPEQRAAIQNQMSAEQRAEVLAKEQEATQSMVANTAQQMKAMQLESTLIRGDIKPIADAFDARFGKPGLFRDELIRFGDLMWHQSGGKTDLTPEQAAQHVIANYGLTASAPVVSQAPPQASPGIPAAQAQGTKTPIVKRTERTIPNVQGRSTSPLKQKPTSIDDLHKLYKRAAAGEQV